MRIARKRIVCVARVLAEIVKAAQQSSVLAAVDFGITQIVDSNVGIHSIIPKWMFNATAWAENPYYEVSAIIHACPYHRSRMATGAPKEVIF